MSPDEAVSALAERLPGADVRVEHGRAVAEVPRERWVEAVAAALALASGFDLLTAVDEGERLRVVLHLWDAPSGTSLLLRTACPVEDPRVPSLTGLLGGADWSERHAAEMFGLVFDGHPDPARLLLPEAFEGAPLRKSFVLASRVVQPWPGAVDPGAGEKRRSRRGAKPLGVPEPGTWGSA